MAKSVSTSFLLVVVLMATTYASGANAEFTITNLCNKTITLSTAAGNTTLLPRVDQIIKGLPANLFGGLVNLTMPLNTTGLLSTITVPTEIVSILDALISLKKLAITCNGTCITLTATVTIVRAPLVLPLGPFCLPTLLPPSPTPAPLPRTGLP